MENNNLKNRFINAIFFGIGGVMFSKAILMLFNMIVARLLTESQYGIYSIINNTVQTFTVFAGAGIGITLTRYVALYRKKNKDKTGIYIKTLTIVNCVLAFIVSSVVFIFSNQISLVLSKEIDISLFLKITSLTIFFTSLMLTLQSILQGFEEFKKVAIVQIISNIVLITLGIVLTIAYKTIGTIITLLILQLVLVALFIISIYKILKERKIKLMFKFDNEVKLAIRDVAIPAFLSTIFVIPVIWGTNFIFTKVNGYEAFAAFSICLQWFTILNYIPQQFGQARPIYTQMYDNGEINSLKKSVIKITKFSVLFAIFIFIVLALFSKLILGLYGEYYENFSTPFIIILCASIFFAIQSIFGSILQAIGKVWTCLILNVVWALTFIGIFVVFINKGVIGYVITYLISYAVYSIISCIVFYNTLKNVKRKEVIEK